MINIRLLVSWLQAAGFRLQVVWVWVLSDELSLSLAACNL